MKTGSFLESPQSHANADDDLTNLNWLHDSNLLRNATSSFFSVGKSFTSVKPEVERRDSYHNDKTRKEVFDDEQTVMSIPPVAYNPKVHIHAKPPYSFSSLIFMAIESSKEGALQVKDIYQWITDNYPYYKSAPSGWKNTVRHNLSLNKCFIKVDKAPYHSFDSDTDLQTSTKGSLWSVDVLMRPQLLQSLRKASVHVYPYMSSIRGAMMGSSLRICRIVTPSQKESEAIESMLRLTSQAFNLDGSLETQSNQSSYIVKEHHMQSDKSMSRPVFSPLISSSDSNVSDDDQESVKGAEVLLKFCKRKLPTDFSLLETSEDTPKKQK